MFCPLYTNKEVFDGFNEIIEAFGGKPMTEEEFRSSELRNQRTGSDYSAMEAAYKIYHLNNGHMLDSSRNGQPSLLFQALLEKYNGNRKYAIVDKSNYYSKEYIADHFDWLSDNVSEENKTELDVNGEPISEYQLQKQRKQEITSIQELLGFRYKFNKSNAATIFGEDISKKLISGQPVSSSDMVNQLLENRTISNDNYMLAEILSNHDIPVRFGQLEAGVIATTVTEDGGSFIVINQDMIGKTTNNMFADKVLHEVVHALTVPAITNPKTSEEKHLYNTTKKMFDMFNKIMSNVFIDKADYHVGSHILENEREFVSEFITDKHSRSYLYNIAQRVDEKQSKTISRGIKNFINAISNFLLGKNFFLNNQQKLEEYEKYLRSFLQNKPLIVKGNLTNKQIFDAVYNSIGDLSIYGDKLVIKNGQTQTVLKNINRNNAALTRADMPLFESIAQILQTRLKALKNSSVHGEYVSQQSQIIEYQADLITRASYIDNILGLKALAQNLGPQVEDDVEFINSLTDITGDNYMEYYHQNIGTYHKLADDCQQLLQNESIVKEMVKASYEILPDKKDLTTPEGVAHYNRFERTFKEETINRLLSAFQSISNGCNTAETKLQTLRTIGVRDILLDIGKAVKSPTIEEYLKNLHEIEYDASIFVSKGISVGSIDNEQDEALRAIAHLIRKANRQADSDTYNACVPLLIAAQKLPSGIKLDDYYEFSDGNTTGYIVRKYNYGKCYDNYDAALVEINRKINEKYGLHLLDDNRFAPDEENARREWNTLVNNWKKENQIRRFKDEYYEALVNLPTEAQQRMRAINQQIYQIDHLPGVMGEDGHPHLEKLTQEQWEMRQGLVYQKKLLQSDYDEWGNLKSPEELKIAKAIQEFYKAQYKDTPRPKKDRDSWVNARLAVLASFGLDIKTVYDEKTGIFYENKISKYISEHPEYAPEWKLWNQRNSRRQFIVNEDGEALIFKQMEAEMAAAKPDYGLEEAKITEEINKMMRTFYGINGQVQDKLMSKAMQRKLSSLYVKRSKLRNAAKKKNPALKAQADKYGAIMHKYIKFEETERFKQIKKQIYAVLEREGRLDDVEGFYSMMKEYAVIKYADRERTEPISYMPFRWFTEIRAVNPERWEEWVPGDAYNDLENSNSFKNKEYERLVKEAEEEGHPLNVSFIPKGKQYNNSAAYNKVKDTDFYQVLTSTMDGAYGKMKNRVHADPYLLPQITGTLFNRISGAKYGGKVNAAMEWAKDHIGLNGVTQNDTEYLIDYDDSSDESKMEEPYESRRNKIGTLSNFPDGQPLHIIPQFYTKRKNPQAISRDLIGIVSTFYAMSARYDHKSQIKNDCEMIVDMIKDRTYKKKSLLSGSTESVKGVDTRTYSAARKFLDMNLYGIRQKNAGIEIAPDIHYEFTKTLQLIGKYTTANNLGANPKVALVGYLTTTYGHMINAVCGNAYNPSDAAFAAKTVTGYMVKNLCGARTVGATLSDDKLIVIMERFNLSNQLKRKFSHSNWNRAAKVAYENSIFGFLSSADFVSKSTILVSVLHSYRYIDGKFMSRESIIREGAKLPKEQRERFIDDAKEKYNQKDVITLYDVIDVKDKKFNVKKEYKKAFDDIYYEAQSVAEKLAERADGMATEEQKAAITQSVIGSLVLIHRQYLPIMWHERFGKEVYDYDMHMYKGGQYHMIFDFIKQYALSSTKKAALVGGIMSGYIFGMGIPAFLIGAAAGAAFGQVTKSAHSGISLKEIYNKMFNDDSSEDARLRSYHHRKLRKQILLEVAFYKLVLLPLISMLCSFSDGPDEKNKHLLQFLALTLRQFQWEAYTPYRLDDTLSNLKSVSASTGTIDDIENSVSALENFTGYFLSGYFSSRTSTNPVGVLYDTLLWGESYDDPTKIIRSGPYKGNTKGEKIFYKLFPYSNMYEQYYGSKEKRKYIENQIMKLNK